MYVLYLKNLKSEEDYLMFIKKKLPTVKIFTYAFNGYMPLTKDAELLVRVLSSDAMRAPVFFDAHTAFNYPELLRKQFSIVLFKHQQRYNTTNDMMPFNEVLCAQHSAKFDYVDERFVDSENAVQFQILDVQSFKMTDYSELSVFKEEHLYYPTPLLSRQNINLCEGEEDKLRTKFENRHSEQIVFAERTKKSKAFSNELVLDDNTYFISLPTKSKRHIAESNITKQYAI